VIAEAGTATRSDLLGLAPKSYEDRLLKEHGQYIKSRNEARRFAAGRLIWCLSMRGDVCVAGKVGQEQAYAARESWFPGLKWPETEPREASIELTRRYLRFNGPATVKDVAHYFGARVREATAWVEALTDAGELIEVACGDRKGLVALGRDATELRRKPPGLEQGAASGGRRARGEGRRRAPRARESRRQGSLNPSFRRMTYIASQWTYDSGHGLV